MAVSADLWSWAIEVYARPGVEALCLELQDAHGQSVPLLLWAAWAGEVAEAALQRSATFCRQWEADVTAPLRTARRQLKPPHHLVDDASRERLRLEVKAAELSAERVLLQALEAMTPAGAGGGRSSSTLLRSLRSAAHAFRGAPEPLLVELAGRLSAEPVESSDVLL